MKINRQEMFSTPFVDGKKPVCGAHLIGDEERGDWTHVEITYWDSTKEVITIEEYRANPVRLLMYEDVVDRWVRHYAEQTA